ncbi:MAG: lysoplasmalogenase [Chloroflexi bacterium]|nr:lysoplasmalogenase [Chloroflexota bacterium]MBC7265141.1 lysoplasmalogenase [Chloroflexota bacterium]
MYPFLIPQPYRGLLYVLLFSWAMLLVFGFAFGPLNETRTNRIPLPNRMASSFILVLCAVIWWRAGAGVRPLAGYTALIVVGMACGFLGDLIMAAEIIPMPERVIYGMVAFGLGHIFYIAAYLRLGGALGLTDGRARILSLAALFIVALATWWALIRGPQAPAVLNYGSLGYALLLSAMVGLAVALAVQEPRFIPLALGAILFLVSDTILGNELFRGNVWTLVGDVVWLTYIAGQALIVFSTASALYVAP